MFDFLRKDSDEGLPPYAQRILQENGFEELIEDKNFHLFVELMTRGLEGDPSDIVSNCMTVIVSLSTYCELSSEDFEEVLNTMRESFEEQNTPEARELRKSMLKYGLV